MNQPIVIPYVEGDDLIHTHEHPFCADMTCLCHEDQDAIMQLAMLVLAGLLTQEEADARYRGITNLASW